MASCAAHLGISLLLACCFARSTSASTINSGVRTFGHSIKNGHLPAKIELETFAHTCAQPPCVVTQIHLPSIYSSGEASTWQDGRLRLYIDGEEEASLDLLYRDIALLGRHSVNGTNQPADGSPWGLSLFGHTAKNGGVYTTIRIPFLKTLRVTITASTAAKNSGTFWMIIRGLEATPVSLGELVLPEQARLRMVRTDKVLQPLEMLSIAESASGGGALLLTRYEAEGSNYGYLEGCLRMLADANPAPLFLSSGVEDYFLSSTYFDEGMFKTEESGLTYFDGKGSVTAYKTHIHDPVVWGDSMQLIWRCGEATAGCGNMSSCPDRFCPAAGTASAPFDRPELLQESSSKIAAPLTAARYSTLVMFYTWPKVTDEPSAVSLAGLLSRLAALSLPQEHFDAAAEKILGGDATVSAIVAAELTAVQAQRLLARHLASSAVVSI